MTRTQYTQPTISYQYPNRVDKLVIDLGVARTNVSILPDAIKKYVVDLTILDKGTGTFTLRIVNMDGTTTDFTQAELSNGDKISSEIQDILLTNSAQSGLTLKLVVASRLPLEGEV